MQVIGDFRDWKMLDASNQLPLRGDRVRVVTIEVNSPGAVALHLVHEDGTFDFIGRVSGREKLKFIAGPNSAIAMEPLEASVCYVHTRDGQTIHRPPSVKEAFTKYHERQPFDPRTAAIMQMMRANAVRMDNALAEMKATKEALNAERSRADQAEATAAAAAQAAAATGGDGGTGPDETDSGGANA